jgi:O-acetyl-ADP-ribose deacetylase (regulator of RNase III)
MFEQCSLQVSVYEAGILQQDECLNNCSLQVSVYEAGITSVAADCIVNPAGERLELGGQVSQAILRAVGKHLEAECAQYVRKNGHLDVGQASLFLVERSER